MKQCVTSFLTGALVIFLTACASSTNNKEKSEVQDAVSDVLSGSETLLVYQFKIKEDDSLKPAGQVKLYLSDNAARSEMNMQLFGQENSSMVMLASMNNPEETILLNTNNKTYTKLNITLPSSVKDKMNKMTKDSMVVIGQEELNGYNCTQVNIITTYDIPSAMVGVLGKEGGSSSVTKYWMSKEIPGYENMSNLLKSRPKMMNGISAEVYQYGVPIKQVNVESGQVKFLMELVNAQEKDIPDEMFVIPDGFAYANEK